MQDKAVMHSENKQQEISQVIQKEIECARMLLQSLDQEFAALAERHADALEEAVSVKQERIQQLELVSRQREKLLIPYSGVTVDKNNQHYQFNGDKQIAQLWNELVYVAEKCREKNRVNGSIVELVSKQSRHALDILHGILPDASSVSELYNNAGQTTKSVNKRSIVQV